MSVNLSSGSVAIPIHGLVAERSRLRRPRQGRHRRDQRTDPPRRSGVRRRVPVQLSDLGVRLALEKFGAHSPHLLHAPNLLDCSRSIDPSREAARAVGNYVARRVISKSPVQWDDVSSKVSSTRSSDRIAFRGLDIGQGRSFRHRFRPELRGPARAVVSPFVVRLNHRRPMSARHSVVG